MIPTPGDIVTANGLRYLVDAVDDVCVTYRTWQGTNWSDPRAIVRASWIALTSPGWVEADEDFTTTKERK